MSRIRLIAAAVCWTMLVAAARPTATDPLVGEEAAPQRSTSQVHAYDNSFSLDLRGQWAASERDGWFATFGDEVDFENLPIMAFTFYGGADLDAVVTDATDGALTGPFRLAEGEVAVTRIDDPILPSVLLDRSEGADQWLYLMDVAGGVLLVSWHWPVDEGPDAQFKMSLASFVADAFTADPFLMQRAWKQSRLAE